MGMIGMFVTPKNMILEDALYPLPEFLLSRRKTFQQHMDVSQIHYFADEKTKKYNRVVFGVIC